MNLYRIFKSIRSFYKSVELLPEEQEKLAEELDNKNIRFRFIYDGINSEKTEGIQIYGNNFTYQDLENLINQIRN